MTILLHPFIHPQFLLFLNNTFKISCLRKINRTLASLARNLNINISGINSLNRKRRYQMNQVSKDKITTGVWGAVGGAILIMKNNL